MTWEEYDYGTTRKERRSALLDDECVKCGSFDNTYRFHDYCDLSDVEHIHYSCYACGYAWSGQTVEQMRNESNTFAKWKSGGIYTMGDWSDWDDNLDYRIAQAEAEDEIEYLGSFEREDGPVLSER